MYNPTFRCPCEEALDALFRRCFTQSSPAVIRLRAMLAVYRGQTFDINVWGTALPEDVQDAMRGLTASERTQFEKELPGFLHLLFVNSPEIQAEVLQDVATDFGAMRA